MQLIVVSSAEDVADEPDIINALFNAGLCRFHLRKPLSSVQKVCALLNNVNPVFYHRIALHQHHEVAQTYGITRLHYTEQARKQTSPELLELQKAEGYKLSTSIHNMQLLPSLTVFDYAFFGPVFDSLSKPGYQSCIGADFRLNKQSAQPEVIALGGVEAQHLPQLKTMRFDGAAVLGTIWNQPQKALQTFEQLKSSITAL